MLRFNEVSVTTLKDLQDFCKLCATIVQETTYSVPYIMLKTLQEVVEVANSTRMLHEAVVPYIVHDGLIAIPLHLKPQSTVKLRCAELFSEWCDLLNCFALSVKYGVPDAIRFVALCFYGFDDIRAFRVMMSNRSSEDFEKWRSGQVARGRSPLVSYPLVNNLLTILSDQSYNCSNSEIGRAHV